MSKWDCIYRRRLPEIIYVRLEQLETLVGKLVSGVKVDLIAIDGLSSSEQSWGGVNGRCFWVNFRKLKMVTNEATQKGN